MQDEDFDVWKKEHDREIDRLRSQNAKMRLALEKIIKDWDCDYIECQECGGTEIAKQVLREIDAEEK